MPKNLPVLRSLAYEALNVTEFLDTEIFHSKQGVKAIGIRKVNHSAMILPSKKIKKEKSMLETVLPAVILNETGMSPRTHVSNVMNTITSVEVGKRETSCEIAMNKAKRDTNSNKIMLRETDKHIRTVVYNL